MPRNPAGTYSLPAGNPVVTNTPITIAWGNSTLNDLASAMTASFDRTGATGGMTGQFKSVDGTAGAPGLTFGSDSTTGFSITTPGELDVSISGALVSRWTSAGFAGTFDSGSTWKFPLYNNHGNQTFTGGLDFTLGDLTVGGSTVRPEPTFTASSSTGTFSTTSTTFTAVTNANLTYTATGGLVMVQLSSDFTSNTAFIGSYPSSGSATPVMSGVTLALSEDGGSTFKALQSYVGVAIYNLTYLPTQFPVSGYVGWITPAAGAGKTIGLYAKTSASTTALINYCKLTIIRF